MTHVKVVSIRSERGLTEYAPFFLSALVKRSQTTLHTASEYVWTFTTDKYFVFQLSKTREATIAHEFLKNYDGILITDFYSGYDAIACRQQKCWVHLIRDLNDDLWLYPFDSQYETFIMALGM